MRVRSYNLLSFEVQLLLLRKITKICRIIPQYLYEILSYELSLLILSFNLEIIAQSLSTLICNIDNAHFCFIIQSIL